MKEVNCQYTFGVFTHWDKCIAAKKKDDGRADTDDVRKQYEMDYRESFEAHHHEAVFFVDAKSVEEIKVSVSR